MSLGCGTDTHCGCSKLTEEGLAGILGDLGWTGTCGDPRLDGSMEDANAWSTACYGTNPVTGGIPTVKPLPPSTPASAANLAPGIPNSTVYLTPAGVVSTPAPSSGVPNQTPPGSVPPVVVAPVATVAGLSNVMLLAAVALLCFSFFSGDGK